MYILWVRVWRHRNGAGRQFFRSLAQAWCVHLNILVRWRKYLQSKRKHLTRFFPKREALCRMETKASSGTVPYNRKLRSAQSWRHFHNNFTTMEKTNWQTGRATGTGFESGVATNDDLVWAWGGSMKFDGKELSSTFLKLFHYLFMLTVPYKIIYKKVYL